MPAHFLYFSIALILSFHCSTLVFADTLILTDPEDSESAAIAEIEAGIMQEDPDARRIIASDIGFILESAAADNVPTIILGKALIARVPVTPGPPKAVAGGFYGALVNSSNLPTLSLDPGFTIIAEEIRKTGFPLRRLVTVTTEPDTTEYIKNSFAESGIEGVEMTVIEASDERSTARAWFRLLRDIEPSSDAVLIVDDGHLESSGSFRHLIESSWKSNILVVSTLPKYARRGVGIGFIPDLPSYGQQLHRMAVAVSNNESVSINAIQSVDLRVLIRVFNERTINHIDIRLPKDIDRLLHDDLVLP